MRTTLTTLPRLKRNLLQMLNAALIHVKKVQGNKAIYGKLRIRKLHGALYGKVCFQYIPDVHDSFVNVWNGSEVSV